MRIKLLLLTVILGINSLSAMKRVHEEDNSSVIRKKTRTEPQALLMQLPPEMIGRIIRQIDSNHASPQEFIQNLTQIRVTNKFFNELLNPENMGYILKEVGYTQNQLDDCLNLVHINNEKIIWLHVLLNAGADIDTGKDSDLGTPLLRAATKGQLKVVQFLVERDANVNAGDDHAYTPLSMAACGSSKAYIDIVQLLLEKGANINAKNFADCTALWWAIEYGDDNNKDIVKLLLKNGADVNVRDDEDGRTILLAAARKGLVKIIKLLLDANADINAAYYDDDTEEYNTPVIMAAAYWHEDAVQLLLERGATIDIRLANLLTYPLHMAAEAGRVDFVKFLLENTDKDIDINEQDDEGSTSLHIAAKKGHKDIVQLLLKNGADVTVKDDSDKLSDEVADEAKHFYIAQLIRNHFVASMFASEDNT